MLMRITSKTTATDNVAITKSNSKILFQNYGRLIPELNFATIRVKISLSNLANESKDICETARTLKSLLEEKLKPCVSKASYNTCDVKAENREEYLEVPWKGYIKKKIIQALTHDLHNICLDNHRRLREITETYKLKDLDEKKTSPQNNDEKIATSAPAREKRQVVAAVLAGIVTSLVSTFSSFQLFGMSQSNENEELINNQNHIISALQDAETRLTRNEEDIRLLRHHLTNMEVELQGFIKQDIIFAEATAATNFARAFNNHLAEIQHGLFTLFKNKLDPTFINLTVMEEAIAKASILAKSSI